MAAVLFSIERCGMTRPGIPWFQGYSRIIDAFALMMKLLNVVVGVGPHVTILGV